MKYWTASLNDFSSFAFHFHFQVTPENFKRVILKIDEVFLIKGLEFGICVFDGLESLEEIHLYIAERKKDFWLEPKYNNALDFFSVKESKSYKGEAIQSQYIPFIESNKYVYKKKDYVEDKIIEFEGAYNIREAELRDEFWEEKEISFSIFSYSNIWWDEISFSKMSNAVGSDIILFEPPKDNRNYAYRITPRLNSFLRDLTKVSLSLGGKVILEDYKKENVTKEGILLDQRIIFQEDIDDGRINMQKIERLR